MPRNGSGGYVPPINSFNPATNGVSATPVDWNATLSDIATAIQQSISSDGQTPITGNLQMGGNRLTGLGAGSATGQSLRFEQLFSQGALVDIPSAGVMDIGTPLTNFLRVTGSTTITGFGTNYNGPRYLIFAAAVILTHSATLVLPGAANITTGINDSLIAVPISGGWQVVAYQRASGLPAVAGPLASSGITGAAASGLVTASGLTQSTARILGRTTAATGAVEEIIAGNGLTLAAGALSVTGRVVAQIQTFQTGAVATGTTTIPYDDTIPQQTEGDQYMSLAITPTNASSTLEIDVVIHISNAAAVANNIAALFQDSTANALKAMAHQQFSSAQNAPIVFKHIMTAGTASATTFKVRAGGITAGTLTFNGVSSGRLMGGVMASSITIKEYLP